MSLIETNRTDCDKDGVVKDGKDILGYEESERSDQVESRETPDEVWRHWQNCD